VLEQQDQPDKQGRQALRVREQPVLPELLVLRELPVRPVPQEQPVQELSEPPAKQDR